MWKDFKEFAFKGKVIDLAIAVVIGTAFAAIVKSLVEDIITPLIGLIMGGVDFKDLKIAVGDASVMYGNFIQASVNFLLIAFCIFIVIRIGTKARFFPKEADPEPAPAGPTEAELLAEIRDLLKEKS